MPVWGTIIGQQIAGEPHRERQTLLHAQVLGDYIRTIQQP